LILFFCCSVHFLPGALGQVITISEELPLRTDYSYRILGWIGDDLMLFRDRGHEFYVQSFDQELHLKWEREISISEGRADVIGIVAHPEAIHLFVGIRDKGDYVIQHRRYNGDINLIDTTTLGRIDNIFITPRMLMAESEDKSNVVVFRENGNSLVLTSYDIGTSSVLWDQQFDLPAGQFQHDYRSMEVSNTGDFYLVIQPDRFLQKVQQLQVYSYSNRSPEVIHQAIDFGQSQVYDHYSQYDNVNGHLIITGLYSDRNISRAEGFYFLNYSPGVPPGIHVLPFDESLLAEVQGKESSTVKGLADFNVQKVALRQDGGAVIIAELNKEFSRRASLPVRRETGAFFSRGGWVDYYYEDLILFAIHPDGTSHWKKVLRKRQYSQDDEAIYSSFFLFKTPDRLRFLFNDEIKQENTVGGYEVTGTGTVERKTVFNTDYQRLKLRFKDGLQVAYNECIVPSERNNRLNLVRIQY
jgi:hypothetical protein